MQNKIIKQKANLCCVRIERCPLTEILVFLPSILRKDNHFMDYNHQANGKAAQRD